MNQFTAIVSAITPVRTSATSSPGDPPSITATLSLTSGQAGVPYNGSIHGENAGSATGVIAYGADVLPLGLALDPDTGVITGTPSAAGDVQTTFTITNGMQVINPTYLFSIAEAQAPENPSIKLTSSLPDPVVGVAYNGSLLGVNQNGASGGISYSVTTLPDGMALNATTGAVTGTPTTVQTVKSVFTASNGTQSATLTVTFTVTVAKVAGIQITYSTPPAVTGEVYAGYITVENTNAELTGTGKTVGVVTLTQDALPSGYAIGAAIHTTPFIAGTNPAKYRDIYTFPVTGTAPPASDFVSTFTADNTSLNTTQAITFPKGIARGTAPAGTPPGTGTHLAELSVVDGGGVWWFASAKLGDDATVPAVYMPLKNSAGETHPGITAWFYADGVDIGATRMDNAFDYLYFGHLKVEYDGVAVAIPASSYLDKTFDFWRWCRMPTIRYGAQVPFDAFPIDKTLLPNYDWTASQPTYNINTSYYDLTMNGIGVMNPTGMHTTGEDVHIGYQPTWAMPFILTPSAANFAAIRTADDNCGKFIGVYVSDPTTGGIVDFTVYPHATTMSYASVYFNDNPVVRYGGSYIGTTLKPPATSYKITACPNLYSGEHQPGYNHLSAMVTHSARDRDHSAFWANFPFLENNPTYIATGAMINGSQRRCAWGMRSIFMAAYVSSYTSYFQTMLSRQLAFTSPVMANNTFGIVNTSKQYATNVTGHIGYRGIAPYQHFYLGMVYPVIAGKDSNWLPYAQFITSYAVSLYNSPYMCDATIYSLMTQNPDNSAITTLHDMFYISLVGTSDNKTPPYPQWTDAQATAFVDATTWEEAFNAIKAYSPSVTMQCVNGIADFRSGWSQDGYTAGMIALVAGGYNIATPGIGPVQDYVDATPTKISFTTNHKYHIVPKRS